MIPASFSFLFLSCDDETSNDPDNYYIIANKKVELSVVFVAATDQVEGKNGVSLTRTDLIFYGKGKGAVDDGIKTDIKGDRDKISISFISSQTMWPAAGIYNITNDQVTPEAFHYLNSGITFAPVDGNVTTGSFTDGQISVSFVGESSFMDFIGLIDADLNYDGINEQTPVTFHFELKGFQGNR